MRPDGYSSTAQKYVTDDAECELEVLEGCDAVARAEGAWRALAEDGGVPTPFQSFPVASAASAAHVRRGETPRIIIVRRNGRPVLIIPTVLTNLWGARVLRFLGDPLIQYGDVIATADVCDADLAAAWNNIVGLNSASLVLLRRVRDDARISIWLNQKATQINSEETFLVELSKPSALGSRNARELRRLRRRLSDLGSTHTAVWTGSDAEDVLLNALELKRDWIKAQGLTSTVIGNPDWERALRDICCAGALTVVVLSVDTRFAAFEVGLRDADCWYGFLGVFNNDFARMGPGQVLTADCIEIARNMGLVCYDQLPPAHDYKRQQATRTLCVRDYALPLTQTGRLFAVAARMAPEIKSLLAVLPGELRRPLLAFSGG
jgi:CelD/BcsL family acetyltransferase involved in cellulose biosynthesis